MALSDASGVIINVRQIARTSEDVKRC